MYENEPVLQAFKLMRRKRIGGIPVVESGGNKAIGNISLRDAQFLLTAPEIYHDYRSVASIVICAQFLVEMIKLLIQIFVIAQIYHSKELPNCSEKLFGKSSQRLTTSKWHDYMQKKQHNQRTDSAS